MQTITLFRLTARAGFILRNLPCCNLRIKSYGQPEDHYSDRMNIHDQMTRDLTLTLIVFLNSFADRPIPKMQNDYFFGYPTVCERMIFWSGRSFIAFARATRSIEPRTTVASPSEAQKR
jgi:hypothetical protein